MTKNFSDAREKLLKAFDGYLHHNQVQIDGLKPHCHAQPTDTFFDIALGKNEPDPGFHDWICWHYYYLLKCILVPFGAADSYYIVLQFDYPFEKIKWWRGQGIADDEEEPDHTAPETVLHNLNALFNMLNFHTERILQWDQIKNENNYQENDLAAIKDAPLSIRIYKTLENLKLRMNAVGSNMEKNLWDFDLASAYNTLEEITPAFEGYIKGVAVQELKSTLANPNLNDMEAIKGVEDQLKEGGILKLLKKNRQSHLERDLKLLSLITMFIGVGIFTTLGLVCKHLYDSGGTSINFFKPLSKNLYETIERVTSGLKDESPNASQLF